MPHPKSRTLSFAPRLGWTLMKSLTAAVLMMKCARLDLVYWEGVTNFIDVEDMVVAV